MNFASSSVKHMGGFILSTFLWGPSALRRTPFSFILISAGNEELWACVCVGGWRAMSMCGGGGGGDEEQWAHAVGDEGPWAHSAFMNLHCKRPRFNWVLGSPFPERLKEVNQVLKGPRQQRDEMNLLVNDVLGFGCCRRPFLMVLHQINANKKANTPEGEEKESMCTLSPILSPNG